MRKTREEEVAAVLKLDGPARFAHAIKRIVDDERAWGLWNEGWALMADDDGRQVFPLWPAREYAERLQDGDWAQYEPREIPLESLLDELIPKLKATGVAPGIFPTPQGKGVTPTPDELSEALRNELQRY